MYDDDEEVVLVGEWLYAGKVPTKVEIVRTRHDYYFEWDTDDGRPNWTPHLPAPDGFYYYVRADRGDLLGFPPFVDAESAKTWANAQPWAPIKWVDT